MLVALAYRGWSVYPWHEAAQNFDQPDKGLPRDEEGRRQFGIKWPAYNMDGRGGESAFEHDHKEHYHDRVLSEEMALISHIRQPIVTCEGCMWYRSLGLEYEQLEQDGQHSVICSWRPDAPPAELPARCAPVRRPRPPQEAARAVLFLEKLECDWSGWRLRGGSGRPTSAPPGPRPSRPVASTSCSTGCTRTDWQCRCCAPVPPEEMFVGKERPAAKDGRCTRYRRRSREALEPPEPSPSFHAGLEPTRGAIALPAWKTQGGQDQIHVRVDQS
ncbi:unnamed protein product [Prorocentrum cordatum]|uniref:Uncharacterized protein n=1 Tax=Prorocentrum cordatum TaxID=2364126 RepID=A0ABN9R4C3_9DINO|nr:unnamed protein product [Polarella glacialis]